MLLSLFFMALIALGGLALTYIFNKDEPLLWRISAGAVIGSAIFGTVVFLIALFFGLSAPVVVAALGVTLLPLVLFRDADIKKNLRRDLNAAKGKLEGASAVKFSRLAYYIFFLVVFVFFFERVMFTTDQGIFTGGSQNLGDLPFHLGAIFSFTDGANFPPENPSFAGAKFSYPFIADLITAAFMKLGSGLKDTMLVQNVAWAFSLLVLLERFVLKLTNDRLASKLAPAILFFSGGLGFFFFFSDLGAHTKGIFDFIWHLPKDYTTHPDFSWSNSLVTLFLTQRSLLLGMPLTLIVLGYLWKLFSDEPKAEQTSLSVRTSAVIGLIAGLLPLVHLHSLVVLFIVTLFLFALRPERWREWIAFGVGVCVTAVPMLIWSITGSATETSKFIAFHFGWEAGKLNFIWFWFKNTGILFLMLAAGLYLTYAAQKKQPAAEENEPKPKGKKAVADGSQMPHPATLLLFYLPFLFLFILSNVVKMAPWEWDNIKVLIYWFVGSIPFIAFALAWMWRKNYAFKFAAVGCFIVLIFSGSLDVWRTLSGQINMRVFDAEAVILAERMKQATAPNALILNAPTYNSAVVLSGRQSLMRYPGHLGSHGIDFADRERDVRLIYSGDPSAEALLQKYGINYVLVSPEERNTLGANDIFFKKYPVAVEAGQYKLYRINN